MRPAAPEVELRVMCLLCPGAFSLGSAHGSSQLFAVFRMTLCRANALHLRERTSTWQEAMVPPDLKRQETQQFCIIYRLEERRRSSLHPLAQLSHARRKSGRTSPQPDGCRTECMAALFSGFAKNFKTMWFRFRN